MVGKRSRSEYGEITQGHHYSNTHGFMYSNCTMSERHTMDWIYERPQASGPFESDYYERSGGFVNGGGCRSFCPDYYLNTNGPFMAHSSIPKRPSDSALLTTLLKRTNPESTRLNIPLFLFELREFPSLLKQLGDTLKNIKREPRITSIGKPSEGGSNYLAYNFGWAPILSDLKKMLTLSQDVHKRFLQYEQIRKKRGKTYKRDLFKGIRGRYQATSQRTIHSRRFVWYSNEYKNAKTYVWGYARYKPKGSLPLTSKKRWQHAWRTYNGLNLRPADLWDAFPWTWLIDYFINVGDYIAANQGSIHFQLVDYALCETKTTRFTAGYYSLGSGRSASPLIIKRTTKSRFRPALSIDMITEHSVPALSGYQCSILGSLALARFLR